MNTLHPARHERPRIDIDRPISVPQFPCLEHPNHCHWPHTVFCYHFDKITALELEEGFAMLVCPPHLRSARKK